MRIERIGDCVLYQADCREVLPTLGKVDAVVTDIPYAASQESAGLRELDYGAWDWDRNLGLSVLASVGATPTIVAFCHWDQLNDIAKLYPDRSWRPIIWSKSNPTVINGQHLFIPFGEFAYYGKLAGAWFGGNCVKSEWRGAAPQERDHPTQKPVELMTWTIRHVCPPDGVALDPFMGSGTTGVACVKLGRKFIGIEIEPKYFDIACKRIEAATKEPRLPLPEPKMKQHSLLEEGR